MHMQRRLCCLIRGTCSRLPWLRPVTLPNHVFTPLTPTRVAPVFRPHFVWCQPSLCLAPLCRPAAGSLCRPTQPQHSLPLLVARCCGPVPPAAGAILHTLHPARACAQRWCWWQQQPVNWRDRGHCCGRDSGGSGGSRPAVVGPWSATAAATPQPGPGYAAEGCGSGGRPPLRQRQQRVWSSRQQQQ